MVDNDYPLNNVEDKVDQAENDIDSNNADIDALQGQRVPLGGVIAWYFENNSQNTLPENYARCDGSTINDAESPFDGNTLPDMNGNNEFLRGNTDSGGTGSLSDSNSNLSRRDVVWVMRIK